jgi:diguanylate cyclase (GGDEF)-like protein/PAS domain S-box-containing protein
MRALVVEDNQGVQQVIVELLERRGFTVSAYPDAESAWAACEHDSVPLMLLDWGLPGEMDGLDLCRRLRGRPGGDRGIILMLTARADEEFLDEIFEVGVSDYVSKPFKRELLTARIAYAERQLRGWDDQLTAAHVLGESQLQALVQHSSDIISVLDGSGTRIYVSPAVERLLGYKPEELVGDSFVGHQWRTDEEREVAARLLADALANPAIPVAITTTARHRNGEVRHFEIIATNLLANPSVRGIVLNSRDITERRLTEDRLHETEFRYRTLVEQIPVHTYIQSLEGDLPFIYVSPQIEEILGYTPEERMAQSEDWDESIHPDDLERLTTIDNHSNATGEPFHCEYRQRHKDGHWVWLRDDALLVHDADGKALFWQGVISDVSQHHATAEALQERDRLHLELLRAAERQAAELRLLDEVGTALARELEPHVIFETVVEAIARTFGYSLVSLYLVEDRHLVLQHVIGYEQSFEKIPLTTGVMGRVARTDQAALVQDSSQDPDFISELDGTISEVCVPLHDGDRVVGVLNLESLLGTPLTEADLRLMTAVAVHVDSAISRARLYTEARESERRYRSVVDSVQEVIFQTDGDGRWTFLNPAWVEITGYSIGESLGQSLYDVAHPDDREWLLGEYDKLIRGATLPGGDGPLPQVGGESERGRWHGGPEGASPSFQVEVRIITSSGDTRWLETRARLTESQIDTLAGISGTLTDITERKRAEEALRESQERYRHLAMHDPLTSLPNRALFFDRLESAMTTRGRRGNGIAVLFLDLDGFKLVNDSLGHEAGDRLLVIAGQRLARFIRPGDTVARLGGDEFAILLDGLSDSRHATRIAERLLESLRPAFVIDGQDVFVSASIGVAISNDGSDLPADLLRNADIALYEAKGSGRGTYAVFEPHMSAPVVARLKQETDLRRAIDRGELRLHYQPAYHLGSGEVTGIEALVRWQHPELGLLAPADFIHAAEATGLVVPMGLWALREACRRTITWHEQTGAQPTICVNLSARQLQDPYLIREVGLALEETGLAPAYLELEITESIVMAEATNTRQTLAELKRLGLRIAIDDFGTGYSSLSYLRDLPVDTLKIDRSFVAGLDQDQGSQAIIRAIATLAHELGLVVTAEGIETADQLALVRTLGIDIAQGYFFTRPVPPEHLDLRPTQTGELVTRHEGTGTLSGEVVGVT